MKHYTKLLGYELDDIVYRRCFGGKAESIAETKRIYRGRERAALKRMVEEMAVEGIREYLGIEEPDKLERAWDKAWRELQEAADEVRFIENIDHQLQWLNPETYELEYRPNVGDDMIRDVNEWLEEAYGDLYLAEKAFKPIDDEFKAQWWRN